MKYFLNLLILLLFFSNSVSAEFPSEVYEAFLTAEYDAAKAVLESGVEDINGLDEDSGYGLAHRLLDHLLDHTDNLPIFTEIMAHAVRHGLDVNIEGASGFSILERAVLDENFELVEAILQFFPEVRDGLLLSLFRTIMELQSVVDFEIDAESDADQLQNLKRIWFRLVEYRFGLRLTDVPVITKEKHDDPGFDPSAGWPLLIPKGYGDCGLFLQKAQLL